MLLLTIQSSTFIFSDSVPCGCWNTLPPPFYWCVDFAPLWITSAGFSFAFFFSGSCWQNLQTAMYILNRQSTMLPAGQPRCSQLTHIVDQEFHGESCLWARGRGWKIFEGSQRTQPLTATYFFFQSRKESIKSKILYVKTYFRPSLK